MAKHSNKDRRVIKMIKELKKNNFEITITNNNGYKILYIPNNEFHSFHPSASNKGYHPLRRWVNCVAGIKI